MRGRRASDKPIIEHEGGCGAQMPVAMGLDPRLGVTENPADVEAEKHDRHHSQQHARQIPKAAFAALGE